MMIITTFAPPGELTWYKYKKDKLTGKPTHRNKNKYNQNGYSILSSQYLGFCFVMIYLQSVSMRET